MPESGASPQSLLEISNLTIRFETEAGPVVALDNTSFSMCAKEAVGLVGESGSGKSVCALSILGLLPGPPLCRVSGKILFSGTNLLEIPEKQLQKLRGHSISMIFQEPQSALNPVISVGNQVAEVFRVHSRQSRRQAWNLAVSTLAQVGLPDPGRQALKYPHELSGGMRQRVLIAMAMAFKPRLLIADEPTTALDVTIQAQILELLRKMMEEIELSILFITHDLAVMAQLCDRAVVLYRGQVVEQGPTQDLLEAPSHPYTRSLLASRSALLDR